MLGRGSLTRYVLVVVDSTFRFLSGGGERDCRLFVPDIAINDVSLSLWPFAPFCEICNDIRRMEV